MSKSLTEIAALVEGLVRATAWSAFLKARREARALFPFLDKENTLAHDRIMKTKRIFLFSMLLLFASCRSARKEKVEPLNLPPVVTVILSGSDGAPIFYKAIYQPPPLSREEEVLIRIGFPLMTSRAADACKLAVINSIWRHHFLRETNIAGLRMVTFGAWEGKKEDGWCFDLRDYEAGDPFGEVRSGKSRIIVPTFVAEKKRVFLRQTEKDWPTVYGSGYDAFVAQYLPKTMGLMRMEKK